MKKCAKSSNSFSALAPTSDIPSHQLRQSFAYAPDTPSYDSVAKNPALGGVFFKQQQNPACLSSGSSSAV